MKTIKLSEVNKLNLLSKIAVAMVNQHGYYICLIDGKKTKIVR